MNFLPIFFFFLSRKILKHKSLHLSSDHRFGFSKGCSTANLAFHTILVILLLQFWWNICYCLKVQNISKAFDNDTKVGFPNYPPMAFILLSAILSQLSCQTFLLLLWLDGNCSKFINNGVPQGSVLSSTFFLLLINDLNQTAISDIFM